VTCNFVPAAVTPPANGTASSTLTFAVSSTAALGTFTPQVVGTSGNLTESAAIQLVVTQQQPTVPIPTMTEWGMILFMMAAGLASLYHLRRKNL
jgi:hypothetical protein